MTLRITLPALLLLVPAGAWSQVRTVPVNLQSTLGILLFPGGILAGVLVGDRR